MPIAIMMISALIEFASFWDAKIMANHAAWTCARIATVEAGQAAEYSVSPEPNRLRTKGMTTATTFLMATCAMASMHGSSEKFTQDWYTTLVKEPINAFKQALLNGIEGSLSKLVGDVLSNIIGGDVVSDLIAKLVAWIGSTLFNPIEKFISNTLDKIFNPIITFLTSAIDSNRQFRQLAYAAGRMAEYKDEVISVNERSDKQVFVFGQAKMMSFTKNKIDFPQVLPHKVLPQDDDDGMQTDGWFVTKASSWPPNNQCQRLIDVTISWPFERAWLFPVLSNVKLSDKDAKSFEKMPKAVGRAMIYPQPLIKNEHLKSVGAEAFDPGNTNKPPAVIEEFKQDFLNFMQLAKLSYEYRFNVELIGPYDNNDAASGSHKGIGIGIAGSCKDNSVNKDYYYTADGLCVWMGRVSPKKIPRDAKDERAAEWALWTVQHPPPPDYMRCFKEVVLGYWDKNGVFCYDNKDETCLFWRGAKFLSRSCFLERLENRSYFLKEWFFWGYDDLTGPYHHLRYKHAPPRAWFNKFHPQRSRSMFFVVKDDAAPYPFVWPLYKDRLKAPETFNAYEEFAIKQHSDAFGLNACRMVRTCCGDEAYDAAKKMESEVYEGFMERLPYQEETTLKLARDCLKELRDALGNKPAEIDSSSEFFDFGVEDEEILKDPEKAVTSLRGKLEKKKRLVLSCLREVDKCEWDLRELDRKLADAFDHVVRVRAKHLTDFAVATWNAMIEVGANREAVIAYLRAHPPWEGEGPLVESRKLYAVYKEYSAALVKLYNAELELGKALECRAAKGPLPRKPDIIPPLRKPDPDPAYPKPSDATNGSDDDKAGENWSYNEKSGWSKSAIKESDI